MRSWWKFSWQFLPPTKGCHVLPPWFQLSPTYTAFLNNNFSKFWLGIHELHIDIINVLCQKPLRNEQKSELTGRKQFLVEPPLSADSFNPPLSGLGRWMGRGVEGGGWRKGKGEGVFLPTLNLESSWAEVVSLSSLAQLGLTAFSYLASEQHIYVTQTYRLEDQKKCCAAPPFQVPFKWGGQFVLTGTIGQQGQHPGFDLATDDLGSWDM